MCRGAVGQKRADRACNSPWRTVAMFMENKKVAFWRVLWMLLALLLAGVCALGLVPNPAGPAPGFVDSASVDSRRVACAVSLTQSQLAGTAHITVLGHAPWLSGFLQACNVPVTLLRLGVGRVSILNQLYDVVFVVLDSDGNSSFAEEALAQMRRGHTYHTAGDAQTVVDTARRLELVHLVVVTGSGAAQRVFQYREDCESGAIVARAILAGRCNQTSFQQTGVDLFPHHLRWNLKRCPLRLRSLNIPGFCSVVPRREGGYTLTGLFAPLAFYLAELVNGTLEVTPLKLSVSAAHAANVSDKYILQDLVHNRTDVLFGVFSRSKEDESLADYSVTDVTSAPIVCVPSGLGASPSPFSVVHREFPPDVWTLLGLSFVAVLAALVPSWWGVLEHPVQDAAFFAMSALLGNSFVVHGTITGSTRVRAVTALWLIFCIVLGTAYQAVRHSLFAAPREEPQINSLAELAQSGLGVIGTPGDIRNLRGLAQEKGDPTFLKLLAQSQAVSVSAFEKVVERMATQRDTATFADMFASTHYVGRVELAKKRRLVHIVPGCCEANIVNSVFVLRKGSRYTSTANEVLFRYYANGLDTFMRRHRAPRHPETKPAYWSQFGLSKLVAPFLLMVIGLVSSWIVFVIENLVYRATRQEVN